MTSPSLAATSRFAIAVIVDVPRSMISMGSAATVTTSFLLATVTSNDTVALSAMVCDVVVTPDMAIPAFAVTVTVAVPGEFAVNVTVPPDAEALTNAVSFDEAAYVAV